MRSTLLIVLTILFGGCLASPNYIARLQSDSPIEQMKVAAWLGKHKVVEAVPELIELLDESDPAVRLSAHRALVNITSEDFGYRFYEAEPQLRAEAIERYRKWWSNRLESTRASSSSNPESAP